MKKMIDWYFKILQPISIVAHSDLQLSPGENRLASTLQKILNNLDILTVTLQNEDLSLSDVREYLDVAIQAFPELSEHCGPQSRIVVDQAFESAVVKIQKAQQFNENLPLTNYEANCVQHLKKQDESHGEKSDIAETVQESDLQTLIRELKKRKTEAAVTSSSRYVDLRFIKPTSNKCEQLFSISGFAFTKNPQGLLPINLEMQLFLHANQHLWDAELFHSTDLIE